MSLFTTIRKFTSTSTAVRTSSNTTSTITSNTTVPTTPLSPMDTHKISNPNSAITPPHQSKDVREFEHGRQKVLKTARTQVWREEKARNRRIKAGELPSQPRSVSRGSANSGSGVKLSTSGVRPDWEEGASAWDVEDEWRRDFEELDGGATRRDQYGRLEVNLTNLIQPAKPRKAKRQSAAGDFEVLPSVRQVVALDDQFDGELEAVDEPWEHLSADGEDTKPVSYAQVAAFAC